MENEQQPATENRSVPAWLEPLSDEQPQAGLAREAFSTAFQPSVRSTEQPVTRSRSAVRVRKRGFGYHLGLQITGLCCYAVLIMLAALVWGFIIYSRQGYISGEGLLPVYIFLGTIFLSSCLITVLSCGGAIFPALLFSLLANVISLILAELSWPPLGSILIKTGLSLLCAAAGFTLTKLLIINLRKR